MRGRLAVVVGWLETLHFVPTPRTFRRCQGSICRWARYAIELDLRPPAGTSEEAIIAAVLAVQDVEILEAGRPTE